jgi:hypothetical protein
MTFAASSPSRLLSFCLLFLLFVANPARGQQGWTDSGARLSPDGEHANELRLEMDLLGNTFAVWTTRGAALNLVRASRLPAGSDRWSSPVTLAQSTSLPGTAYDLALATSVTGDAVAVWTRAGDTERATEYARYDAAAGNWTVGIVQPAVGEAFSPAAVITPSTIIFLWYELAPSRDFISLKSAYLNSSGWSSVATIAADVGQRTIGDEYRMVVDSTGLVTAIWPFYLSATGAFTINVSQSMSQSGAWTTIPVDTGNGEPGSARLDTDPAGNVAALWTLDGSPIRTARFDRATGSWSSAMSIPGSLGSEEERHGLASDLMITTWAVDRSSGAELLACHFSFVTGNCLASRTLSPVLGDTDTTELGVDGLGNALAIWGRREGSELVLYSSRYVASSDPEPWSDPVRIGSLGEDGENAQLTMNAAGNAMAGWVVERADIARARPWIGTAGAPTITSVIPGDGSLSVAFTPPVTAETPFQPINYEYSLDSGDNWETRAPVSNASPLVISGLTNGRTYTIRIRAINRAGRGAVSNAVTATPGLDPLPAPVELHIVSNVGTTVTLAWTQRTGTIAPTEYEIEGGLSPGEVLATIRTGSAAPTFTFAAPPGSFFVRVRALAGTLRSAASNEIPLVVNPAQPPGAPQNLTGQALGSTLNLSWRLPTTGGAPDRLILNGVGSVNVSLNLPPTSESFSFNGVPNGAYIFSLRAANRYGVSRSSNAITLSFGQPCIAPAAPGALMATVGDRVVTLAWTPPPGPAPTSYWIEVGSVTGDSDVLEFSTGSSATSLSATAPAGTYYVRVRASNACGFSNASAETVVVVP